MKKWKVKYKRIYLLLLIPIALLITVIAKNNIFFAEHIMAKYIYKGLSQMISLLTGILPFSLSEIIIIISPLFILFLILRLCTRFYKEKENKKTLMLYWGLNLLSTLSVLLFAFIILCGTNYYRYPFSYYSGLEVRESSVEELFELCISLAKDANRIREGISSVDEDGVFKLSKEIYDVADDAKDSFKALAKKYPVLRGYYSSPKPVLLSRLMSKTEITGIFIPFTMEANVNVDIPDYSIPATMNHELAHLRGFMREDEANFISYLACMESDDLELQYSGTMLALVISRNALYNQDKELYSKVGEIYSEDVLKDSRANSRYWQEFEDTTISVVSNKINDTYLKVNNQSDGVKSYGRMVDLLLAKYRNEK